MDPQYLLKDEVEFELACRGYTHGGGLVSALKRILKKMIQVESTQEVSYAIKAPQSCTETPELQLEICADKINAILCYVSELNEKPDQQLYKRLVSRLIHIVNRLKLVSPKDELEEEKKKLLLDKTALLMSDLEVKDELEDGDDITPEMKEALQTSLGEDSKKILNLIDKKSIVAPTAPSTSKSENEIASKSQRQNYEDKKVNFAQDDLDLADFNNEKFRHSKLFNSTTFEDDRPPCKQKLVPISQWGVHYSGDNSCSVNAFIERVDELKEARNATDLDLWRHAIDFFKGDALIWFRANREYVNDWKELVILLKRTFQAPYYQEELLAEAKSRTQGKHESVLIFIAVLQNMFNRLPNKIPETEKIMIIVKNLQPYYQRAVCRDTFTSIADLINVLRIVERTKINCDNFQEPKTFINSLEPDLAYKATSTPMVDKEILEIKNVAINNGAKIKIRCWNCRESGHAFRSCPVPKQRLFCFKCGRFGVTSKDCTCKGNAIGESAKPAN
ncbi:uncharacterized protein LOC119189326 [Manduca sexta]|uniref:uncharacterized protein LOC119189326 n=1 Tax=Manduca sexta TaxID=7130 RepID=UPI00188E28B0|nr:uncharacterized protein LOC119189326 [Manduca sexta]